MCCARSQANRERRGIAAFQRALALRTDYPEALGNLSAAYRDNGEPAKAVEAAERAMTLNPHFIVAHDQSRWPWRHVDQGRLEEAIATCRGAGALDPHLIMARNKRGGRGD